MIKTPALCEGRFLLLLNFIKHTPYERYLKLKLYTLQQNPYFVSVQDTSQFVNTLEDHCLLGCGVMQSG
jgi:hypothetical protein